MLSVNSHQTNHLKFTLDNQYQYVILLEFIGTQTPSPLPQAMLLRRAVLQTSSKSSVPPQLPSYKGLPLPTPSKSRRIQLLIPLHFNSPRINTYKKPARGSLLPASEFCNSSLPAPHNTHAKQHPPVSFTSFTSSTSSTSFASPSATPFLATLSSHRQLAENKTTLSRAIATLTDHVKHKSFVYRSYKKHPGWGCR